MVLAVFLLLTACEWQPTTKAGCLITQDEAVLLCLDQKGIWSIPKGEVERGETLRDAAIRETWEEAQILAVPEPLPAFVLQDRDGLPLYVFRASGPYWEGPINPGGEIVRAEYVSLALALTLVSQEQVEMLQKELF